MDRATDLTAPSCTSGNNGNLQSQTISAPNLSVTQTYTYDALNRLTAASENSSGWSQNYCYDNVGNFWVTNSTLSLTPETPQEPSPCQPSTSPYTSQNQVNSWTYDSNGNLLMIPIVENASRNFTYDAENRQVTATLTGVTTTSASYVYDGLGQRVMKFVCSSGGTCNASTPGVVTTTYVYDAFGSLAAEYGPPEAAPCGANTPCYVSVDHLGSTRMLMDNNGNAQKRYDYQPFGAEIPANYAGRTPSMMYDQFPRMM